MSITLIYAHDPMCAWCWGFRPTWQDLRQQLPAHIQVKTLLGGLAPDSDEPMVEDMRRYLRDTWRQIQQRIPGTEFNFDFWEHCRPRRSTYPACRAVIAARRLKADSEDAMILAIQKAYYLQARNPSLPATLIELAEEIGLDGPVFLEVMNAATTHTELREEIAQCRRLRLTSFPSLALEVEGEHWPIRPEYGHPEAIRKQIGLLVK